MSENKEKNFISAVLYVKNVENQIADFIKTIYNELHLKFDKFEIICVDDCSADQSVQEIKNVVKNFDGEMNVTILHMSFPQGRELCMNAGMDLTIGDFIYEFDSIEIDFNKAIIFEIYQTALKGFDIVSAVPNRKSKISSKLFYGIFNRFATNQYLLKTESVRILSRRAINRITSMNKSIPYRKAVYANCGLKCENYLYDACAIAKTYNKAQKRERMSLAIDSLILFSNVAYKFSTALTIIMMGVAIMTAFYAIVIFLTGSPIAGWTTTILFLAFAFFGLFGILTIIIKYLSILVELSFKKQKYIFESIEKLSN